MPKATIIYNGGRSYSISGQKFVTGRPRTEVFSQEVIDYCSATADFTVRVAKKVMREVVEDTADAASDPADTVVEDNEKAEQGDEKAPRKRVHQVAREMGLSSAELMEFLASSGQEVKSHQSALSDAQVEDIHSRYLDTAESE